MAQQSSQSAKPYDSASAPCVLFVDDEESATNSLIQSLRRNGAEFRIELRTDVASALTALNELNPDAVVVDLSIDPQRGPESGLDFISQLIEAAPNVRILVLTGQGTAEFGVRSLQAGAGSFVQKPVDPAHLLALIRDAISFSRLKRELYQLHSAREHVAAAGGFSSRSPKMQKVIEAIGYAASNKQPVLLVGETGTGKGVVAQTIHRLTGRGAPFIRFQPNFGAADMIASELFGHQKGAFTGAVDNRCGLLEDASGGTLFIDEIDELPPETQILLLNVLQEKIFRRVGSNKDVRSDFRLIAATNQPLAETLKKNKLREDFFHRISHLTIELPPLRDRQEDIPDLAEHFASQLITREDIEVQGLTPDAVEKLKSYRWPGNVRELQAVVEGGVYRANYLGKRFVENAEIVIQKSASTDAAAAGSFRDEVQNFELKLINEALEKCGNNQSKAADLLQLDRSTLRRILERGKQS